ncbi:malonate--CoA ligase [Tropicibacter naphthalenivorans]|uniref:Long-chain-fatty-acid--CoA ligase n=1 Tax=Tropicibacter naphthalenivorans TaxID=441103 RepID=A0A0N7LYS5_9RHOB|nr:malonyl-CoA synthase [Tropicibacter naphthalenivorans]CUH75681.1 Long-chain-fatty-acid--CoA ligase [Tropicibacter naphthalenivorans]SMC42841.1 malonyl-CoA/methylmalonyl-CoA synthetase [Tropicibacter naphthalenivorans]
MTNPLYDQMLGRHAGSAAVFLHLPDGRQVSYADFLGRVAQFAGAVRAQGIAPGDRVAIQVGKSADALALIFGCIQAGVVFLPLNTGYTADEMSYFVENSGARLLVCAPEAEAALGPVAEACGAQILTLGGAGEGSLAQVADAQAQSFDTEPRAPEDIAAFLYTSGTTGRSKGAMLSQNNLLSNALTLVDLWRFTDKDVLLHALPIFHTHGLFVATNVILAAGASMVFFDKLDPEALIDWMPRATSLMGVPTFYTRLLDTARFDTAATASMRLFISGSAPLLAETHLRFEERTGHRILERYGMTETNMNTSNPYEGERRAGTVGLPLPGVEVKVCGPDGAEVPRGEIGVLEVRGPNVFQGYWQMPEKTAEELRADGFFITGDLAQQAEDGYVTIVGRNKDLIISGGFNIYPKELESLLDDMPGVLESAVIGVPHPDFGETPVGVLVPKPDETPDLEAIAGLVAEKLARFKHPRKLVLIDALPRNTMGKVQKNALRASYQGLFA